MGKRTTREISNSKKEKCQIEKKKKKPKKVKTYT